METESVRLNESRGHHKPLEHWRWFQAGIMVPAGNIYLPTGISDRLLIQILQGSGIAVDELWRASEDNIEAFHKGVFVGVLVKNLSFASMFSAPEPRSYIPTPYYQRSWENPGIPRAPKPEGTKTVCISCGKHVAGHILAPVVYGFCQNCGEAELAKATKIRDLYRSIKDGSVVTFRLSDGRVVTEGVYSTPHTLAGEWMSESGYTVSQENVIAVEPPQSNPVAATAAAAILEGVAGGSAFALTHHVLANYANESKQEQENPRKKRPALTDEEAGLLRALQVEAKRGAQGNDTRIMQTLVCAGFYEVYPPNQKQNGLLLAKFTVPWTGRAIQGHTTVRVYRSRALRTIVVLFKFANGPWREYHRLPGGPEVEVLSPLENPSLVVSGLRNAQRLAAQLLEWGWRAEVVPLRKSFVVETNATQDHVQEALRRTGVQLVEFENPRGERTPEDVLDYIVKHAREGVPYKVIAIDVKRLFGFVISSNAVNMIARRHGALRRRPESKRDKVAAVLKTSRAKKMLYRDIAASFGVSQSVVTRTAHSMGIIRPRGRKASNPEEGHGFARALLAGDPSAVHHLVRWCLRHPTMETYRYMEGLYPSIAGMYGNLFESPVTHAFHTALVQVGSTVFAEPRRGISYNEAVLLRVGDILYHIGRRNHDGTPLRARVTGKPQVWKKRPGAFSVPLAYGWGNRLTHFRLDPGNALEWRLTEQEAMGG